MESHPRVQQTSVLDTACQGQVFPEITKQLSPIINPNEPLTPTALTSSVSPFPSRWPLGLPSPLEGARCQGGSTE